ncbi:MAG TPA: MaoC family dehydratase [Candidatus Sulfotelmatobacter sp.]|jgi:2-methylfumaryl-CoA hydratase|nr:MaoC family dehydratase [Candidatus Sulfotelmatobacter sp.]
MSVTKTNPGNYFEDFRLGQDIHHATPRTVTQGDLALYCALYGGRFAVQSSDEFARKAGFIQAPVDDLLAFHVVFGKTVPDISLNAVANLGYAEGRFGVPVYPGDTLRAVSKVIGLKENSNRQTGVVYVRSTGYNQRDEMVVEYVRWVMVRKRNPDAPVAEEIVPKTADKVDAADLILPAGLNLAGYDSVLAGSPYFWDDYEAGESIDHVDGMTIEEAEHMSATRLYQNTAKVHFNQHTEGQGRFGRRLIYGGHIISLARSLSFNGLSNAFKLVAINGGRHVAPTFAGDTIYAWTRVEETLEIPGRKDVGALRLRTLAAKNQACAGFPFKQEDGKEYDPSIVLDFDYTVLLPRK